MYYDSSFFKNLEKTAFDSSLQLIPLILSKFKSKSIIDIGCGNGIWLKTIEQFGIKNYLGIDGEYVKKDIFYADYSKFIQGNLEEEVNLNKKFDLAICLEVGEHLLDKYSTNLVKTIINHSDLVIFSAAIPGQSGTNHINEQWQSYWAKKFNDFGYEPLDMIRPIIWNNFNVSYWYRQNIVVYKKTGKVIEDFKFLDSMHPELKFRLHNKKTVVSQFFLEPKYVFTRFLKKRGIL